MSLNIVSELEDITHEIKGIRDLIELVEYMVTDGTDDIKGYEAGISLICGNVRNCHKRLDSLIQGLN